MSAMIFHALGTGYFPDPSALEGGFLDDHGKPLNTLQDFLDGYAPEDRFKRTGFPPYVSAAMDADSELQGKTITITELEREYACYIPVLVCDTGSKFVGKGNSRIDICTRDEKASLDDVINGKLTLNLEEQLS
jgi:hypothetical protein